MRFYQNYKFTPLGLSGTFRKIGKTNKPYSRKFLDNFAILSSSMIVYWTV